MTTEWDDIHRRLGNLPPLAETNPKVAAFFGEEMHDPCTDRTCDSSGTGDDDGNNGGCGGEDEDDAAELEHIRAARLRQLKKEACSGRFGNVVEIAQSDFVTEVNHAGEGVGVVLLLYKRGHYGSNFMLVILERLASKFRDVKFLKIISVECIPGYPDKNLPTILVYRDDDMLRQWVGTRTFGGSSYGMDDVEWELAEAGILKTELHANPHRNASERR